MIYFFLNLFLAIAWMLLNGSYTIGNFLIGFIVGFFALRLSLPFRRHSGYFRVFGALLFLLIYFFWEMVRSVVQVAWDVITPTHLSEPDIVYVPLDAKTDLEITLLANMVSLTPGTLSLDVTPDKKHLVVHAMFASEHDKVIREIKEGLERRILEVTRG
ncbi:Na+/H+ antiporter subunit E [Vibrio mytili]|uniref:Sodium:proton antiporter n=1 Tax=Vibrio mytili TaxID=50718 RepID=A0A0C3DLR6_9VIBR|nr:Na+/H+ antiporter subunit E [Vibrio mytili]KIN12469.1 sodium:proton antiporter [Vibrio mytili]